VLSSEEKGSALYLLKNNNRTLKKEFSLGNNMITNMKISGDKIIFLFIRGEEKPSIRIYQGEKLFNIIEMPPQSVAYANSFLMLPHGDFLVGGHTTIYHLSSAGRVLRSFGEFANVKTILSIGQDKILTLDGDGSKTLCFDILTGKKLACQKWEVGTANAKIGKIMNIANYDKEHIILLDNIAPRVFKYNILNGKTDILAGSGNNQRYSSLGINAKNTGFYYPDGLSVDSKKNIFLIENGTRLLKIDAQNNSVTAIAGVVPGETEISQMEKRPFSKNGEQLKSARGISIDAKDNIYILDSYNSEIKKIDSSGNSTIIKNKNFYYPMFGKFYQGYLWISNSWGNTINRFINGNHEHIAGISIKDNRQNAGCFNGDEDINETYLNTPYGFDWDNMGTLFFVDGFNHRVRKISSNKIVTVLGKGAGYNEKSLNLPYDMLIKDQTLFVSDSGNCLVSTWKMDSIA